MTKLTHYLPFAGAVPFVLSAACLAFGIKSVPVIGSVEKILLIYALVIASFMAGVHWGQHLNLEGPWARALPILSNIIAVSLWLAYLVLSPPAMLALLSGAFAVLLWIDYRLSAEKIISKAYIKTRAVISLLVITSLTLSGVFI